MEDKKIKSEFKRINYKLNLIREEVNLSSMDNVILTLTLLLISTLIAIILFGFSVEFGSPTIILSVFISCMFLLFIFQTFFAFISSIFFEGNRFSNKIYFISILLSFLLFLVLLILIPYFLGKLFPTYSFNEGLSFYILISIIYGLPLIFYFFIKSKIRNFYLRRYANLFYEIIQRMNKEQRNKILKKLKITYKELKVLINK